MNNPISFMEFCAQELYLKNKSKSNDLDVSVYSSLASNINESFISDASASIYELIQNTQFNQHIRAIESTFNIYCGLNVDRQQFQAFFTNINGNDHVLQSVSNRYPVLTNDVVEVIRPKYLQGIVKDIHNRIVHGNVDEISKYVKQLRHVGIQDKLKANVVRVNPRANTDDLLDPSLNPTVPVDSKYISSVLSYLGELKNLSSSLNDTVTSVINTLRTVQMSMNDIIPILFSIEEIDPKISYKNRKFAYDLVKIISEAASYLAYCTVVKIKTSTEKLVKICALHDEIARINESISPEFAESVETHTITNTSTEYVADDFRRGQVDVFVEMSQRLYEFHKGLLSNISFDDVTNEVSTAPYDDTPYTEANKIYIMISNGLDIISKNSDDYYLVFDHLIEKAGFQLRLEDNYRRILSRLDDTTNYDSALGVSNDGNINVETYLGLVHELEEYGDNVANVADAASAVFEKLRGLKNRFNNNINGEYKTAEAINQIVAFFDDLEDQYKKITNIIVTKFMLRIKKLGSAGDELESRLENRPTVDPVEYATNKQDDDIPADPDILASTFEAAIEDLDMINSTIMRYLQESYIINRIKKENGFGSLYIEADDNNTNSTTTSGANDERAQDANGVKAEVKVVDGTDSERAANKATGNVISSMCENIKKWFIEKLNSFTNNMNRRFTKDPFIEDSNGNKLTRSEFINKYKEYLTTRSYANSEVHILPYIGMNEVYGAISNVNNSLRSINKTSLAQINSEIDLNKKLFSFVSNLSTSTTMEAVKGSVQQYVATGNEKPEEKVYKNNEVGTWVKDAISFLETYLNSDANKIKTELNQLEATSENVTKSFQEAVNEMFVNLGRLFMEGTPTDNNAGNNQSAGNNAKNDSNNSDASNVKDKIQWIANAVRFFAGAIMGTVSTRVNNYFDVLKGFTANADKAIAAKNNQNNQNNNDGNNNNNGGDNNGNNSNNQ